jgi:hypothetical protein
LGQRYVALFAGPTRETAKMVVAVQDPELVVSVARAALERTRLSADPCLACLEAGTRGALEQILMEDKARRRRR